MVSSPSTRAPLGPILVCDVIVHRFVTGIATDGIVVLLTVTIAS